VDVAQRGWLEKFGDSPMRQAFGAVAAAGVVLFVLPGSALHGQDKKDALSRLLRAVEEQKEPMRGSVFAFAQAVKILQSGPKKPYKEDEIRFRGMHTYSTHLDEKKLIKEFGEPDQVGKENVTVTGATGVAETRYSKMLRYGWLRIYVTLKGEIWYVGRKYRNGKSEPMLRPEYAKLRLAMAKAARSTFKEYRDRHPAERLYVYALYTDDDATGAIPAANSVQSVEQTKKRYSSRGSKVPNLAYLRYDPAEWSHIGVRAGNKEWKAIGEMTDALSEDGSISLGERRRNLLQAMLLSLKDLDQEGFFGVGAEREAVTLMIWITDSADAETWRQRSIRELNPRVVHERFLADSKKRD
jgi:hypothetical protein